MTKPFATVSAALSGLALAACSPAELRFPPDFAGQSERQSLTQSDGTVDVGGYKIRMVASAEHWDLTTINPLLSKERQASWFGFELVGAEQPWEGQCASTRVATETLVSDEQKLLVVCRFQQKGSSDACDLEMKGDKELETGTATLRIANARSRRVQIAPHVEASGSTWVNVPAARHAGYRVDEGDRTLGAIQLSAPDATWIRKGLGEFRVPVAIILATLYLFEPPARP